MEIEFTSLASRGFHETVKHIKANQISAIRVNAADGYRRKDLEILREFPWVTHLEVVMDDDTDWSPISSLRDLTWLSVDSPMDLNLTQFSKLSVFYGEWHAAQNIQSCAGLRQIAIGKLRADGMQFFETCEQLEDLVLVQSNIHNMRGLNNPRLVDLRVSRCRSIVSLKGIAGAPRLVVLEVSRCPGVKDFTELQTLEYLFDLKLNDIHSVPSLAPLLKSPQLLGLRLVGTVIGDGKVDGLRNLKWVAFDNKRHYSMTEEQLDAYLRPKGGGAVVRPGDNAPYVADIQSRKAAALAATDAGLNKKNKKSRRAEQS